MFDRTYQLVASSSDRNGVSLTMEGRHEILAGNLTATWRSAAVIYENLEVSFSYPGLDQRQAVEGTSPLELDLAPLAPFRSERDFYIVRVNALHPVDPGIQGVDLRVQMVVGGAPVIQDRVTATGR